MMYIIMPIIRVSLLFLGISIALAIIFTVTRYLISMFTALPLLMFVGVFIILLILIFFWESGQRESLNLELGITVIKRWSIQ